MKLQVTYKKNEGVDWDGLVAEISYAEGTFISLGLRRGQKELSDEEVAWLTDHEPEIMAGCEALGNWFRDWETISSDERNARTRLYRHAAKKLYPLRDKFCKDNQIVDD